MLASIVCSALGSGAIARAQSGAQAVDLQWNAPAACMSAGDARTEIAALIRAERAGERAEARVLIEGSNQEGYRARIEIARGASRGERELRGARCDEVAQAAVLIIAMAIDPEGAAMRAALSERPASTPSTGTAPPARVPTNATKPGEPRATATEEEQTEDEEEAELEEQHEDEEEAEPDEEPEIAEPADPRKVGRVVIGLRGTGDAGSLPNATIGGGVLAGVHFQHVRVELQALAYLPQLETAGPQPASTQISLYTGALTACLDVLGERAMPRALGVCAAFEAGLSSGTPRRVSDGHASSGLWLATFFGLDLRQQLVGPLHLRLLAEVGLPVLRPSYEIEPFGRIFRASPALARFGISAFVLFP